MKFLAFNIKYDTDGHRIKGLPSTMTLTARGMQDVLTTGADAISDRTGFCVVSFQVRPIKAPAKNPVRLRLGQLAVIREDDRIKSKLHGKAVVIERAINKAEYSVKIIGDCENYTYGVLSIFLDPLVGAITGTRPRPIRQTKKPDRG